MRKRKASRPAATGNGSRTNHKLILALREAFIKGMFAAAVIMTLIGAAAVDADPVKGAAIFIVSLAVAFVIYVQNVDGRIWK